MLTLERWLLISACLSLAVPVLDAKSSFTPTKYPKMSTTCPAKRRGKVEEIVDIKLSYVEVNSAAPTTIIMVHGWPSLWSTWSNQITEFQDDYHLIVPDLRGFGGSTHPGEPHSSGTMGDMVGDLVCILESANVSAAICMGHDWGSAICYEAARSRPDIFTGVIGAAIPYLPAEGPFVPVKELVPFLPALNYQLFFDQETGKAVRELDADIRRTIRATLRTVASPPPSDFLRSSESFLVGWDDVKEIDPVPFFSQEEEDYFVEQYGIQGFKNTLQFYSSQNRRVDRELAHAQANHTIPQPVLAMYPTQDPVADWVMAAKLLKSADYLPHLTTKAMEGAHWLHIEYPEKFNAYVRSWLDDQKNTIAPVKRSSARHAVDEL